MVTCWGIHDNKASHAHLVLASRKGSHRIFQGLPFVGNAYTHHGYSFHYFGHRHVLHRYKKSKLHTRFWTSIILESRRLEIHLMKRQQCPAFDTGWYRDNQADRSLLLLKYFPSLWAEKCVRKPFYVQQEKKNL